MTQKSTYILYVLLLSSRSNALRTKHIHCVRCSWEYTAKVPTLCERRIFIVFYDSEEYVYTVCSALELSLDFLKSPSSYLFSTPATPAGPLATSSLARPLRDLNNGLTYSTLKVMRSTCSKSKLSHEITLWERSIFTVFCALGIYSAAGFSCFENEEYLPCFALWIIGLRKALHMYSAIPFSRFENEEYSSCFALWGMHCP